MSAHKKTIAMLVLLCAALQLRAQDCAAKETKFGLSPQMLQFDNQGQSFVSGLYQDGLTGLLESTRLWSVCKTQDFDAAARYAALGAQAFLAFRLQFANAYVLHEYAHAESATRLRLSNVRVGADEGHSVEAAPYLANLAHMAFDPRQLGDLGRRGVTVAWDSAPLPADSLTQLDAAGLNLNTYFAGQSFESMVRGDRSASLAMGYAVNKWFSPVYFEMDQRIGGDPSAYVENLARQGIQTNKSAIQQVQLLAALLSNGVWTSARTLLDYGNPSSAIAPLHWTGSLAGAGQDFTIYWPEFSSYLNQRGVSLGGDVALALGGRAMWTLGLERNAIGKDQGTDISLGLHQPWDATMLSGRITLNQGHIFASVKGEYRLSPHVGVTGLVYGTQGETLVGQRLAFRSRGGGYVGLHIYF